jgi:signal transduction histidine kinase
MMLQAVAHDVKNLLTELALRIQLTDPHAAALAHAAADKLTQALLLDNPDQLTPHIDAASPAELLDDVANEYRSLVPDKSIAIDITHAPTLWYYDAALIRLAIGNLVHNALRHCRRFVQLRAFQECAQLFIEIRDDGDGFPENLLGDRADSAPVATRASHHGTGNNTGMGLRLTRDIVAAHVLHKNGEHRGSLTLRNDHGAVATLTLP